MATAEENPITTPVDEAEEEAKAEELFAEAAAEREGEQDDGPADQSGTAAVSKSDDETAGEPGKDGGNAPEPGKDDGAAAPAPASGSGEFDWSKAPPEAKAAFEAAQKDWDHRLKSANGRVSVLDRKLSEVRSQGGGKEQEQPRKPLKELLESDQLKTIGEEYPDLKPVLDTLAEVAGRVDGVTDEVGQVRTQAVHAATSGEERALNQAVPNWLDLAKDERFLGWVDDQPKETRDAVAANWDAITNAEAAAKAFKGFAEHIAPQRQEEAGSGGAPSKRERQQSGTRAAKVTAPASAGGDSDDPDVVFAQAAAAKDRERGIRR